MGYNKKYKMAVMRDNEILKDFVIEMILRFVTKKDLEDHEFKTKLMIVRSLL